MPPMVSSTSAVPAAAAAACATAMGPSCTVLLLMFRLQGRAGPYGTSMSWPVRPGAVLRGAAEEGDSGLAGELVAASSTAARTAASSSGAAETTVTSPVAATALTELTPARAESSVVTAPSQCPQVMPVTR